MVEVSKSEKRYIKEIVRRAVEDWLIWNEGMVEDPFLSLKPVDFGVKTNAEEIGWFSTVNQDEATFERFRFMRIIWNRYLEGVYRKRLILVVFKHA